MRHLPSSCERQLLFCSGLATPMTACQTAVRASGGSGRPVQVGLSDARHGQECAQENGRDREGQPGPRLGTVGGQEGTDRAGFVYVPSLLHKRAAANLFRET